MQRSFSERDGLVVKDSLTGPPAAATVATRTPTVVQNGKKRTTSNSHLHLIFQKEPLQVRFSS